MIDSQAQSLPLWMQISAFAVSLALALLKALDFFRKPTLYLHLTRDVFFRLIENGEALFCSAVLLASNGPILVRNVTPLLKRIDKGGKSNKAEKQFPLLVAAHGEKVSGISVTADHKFFGSSPLQYLEQSKPHRAIYLCFQREYQDKQKKAGGDFTTAVEDFRVANLLATEDDASKLRARFAALIENHYNLMSPLIQIESGDYELQLSVTYECVGWRFFGVRQETVSRLQFSVDDILIDRWKADLKRLLTTRGQQIVTEKDEVIQYPQLEPTEVMEMGHRTD